MKNYLIGALSLLGTCAGLFADDTPFTMPAAVKPGAVVTSAFDVITPYIPTMITVGATLMISVLLYRVVVRKIESFGHSA